MKHIPPPQSFPRARTLRKNATPAEQQLWKDLREYWPVMRFRRQVPIAHYIADFASHQLKLVIELDGGQHSEQVDARRTTVIEAQGYRVVRFWNNEYRDNREAVLEQLAAVIAERTPSSSYD
ncbi:DNA (cytosine-5-)-methyltransferase [Pseudonocardia sp. TMWB2A]|uniref:endonuclease domain-containing protein n=1 Tax=Pseudonocardia sp. TMWB2A TaxID=687430 RepID=UPI00307DAB6D